MHRLSHVARRSFVRELSAGGLIDDGARSTFVVFVLTFQTVIKLRHATPVF